MSEDARRSEAVTLDWFDDDGVALQVEGFDIITLSAIDLQARIARVAVFSNETGDNETPTLLWEGDVKLPTDRENS